MTFLELKVPPLAQLVFVGACMWITASLTPGLTFHFAGVFWLSLVIVGAGILAVLAGAAEFRRAGTTFNPLAPDTASALVDTGIYRWSRNPMYLGLVTVLAGWAVYLSNVLAFAFVPVFVVYMNRFQIQPEEKAMMAKFGADYRKYTESVRRWI